VVVIEAKSTKHASISITVGHLQRVTDAAHAAGVSPAMSYTFENMPPGVDPDWVLIPLGVFNALTGTPEPGLKEG
jgi:Holliday junction resolvase